MLLLMMMVVVLKTLPSATATTVSVQSAGSSIGSNFFVFEGRWRSLSGIISRMDDVGLGEGSNQRLVAYSAALVLMDRRGGGSGRLRLLMLLLGRMQVGLDQDLPSVARWTRRRDQCDRSKLVIEVMIVIGVDAA